MADNLTSVYWIMATGMGLLLSFLGGTWWTRRRTGGPLLQDVIWSVELIDKRMFHSVREIEGKLESILDWTERTEQKLHHLLVQAIAARADQYATAALLISEGKKAEDVARTLKLPPAQVHVIEELRRAVEWTEEPEAETRGNSVKPEPEAQGKIGLHDRAMAMAEREESPISEWSSSQSQVTRRAVNRKRKTDSPTGRKKESLNGGWARRQNGAPHQEKVPIPPDIIKLRESTARLEERLQQDVKTIKQQVYATQAK